MSCTCADVEAVLAFALTKVPDTDMRLVGTASSVMRGIDLPANDIDLLFRQRAGVDAWFDALSADLDVETAPEWLGPSCQYFARLQADSITVELSTVEIETDRDTCECFGEGPWLHFDAVPCGTRTVPAVATELRLITEVSRGRADRYHPIIEHLRVTGCDAALVRRGFADADVANEQADTIMRALSFD